MKITRKQLQRIIKEELAPQPEIFCDMDGVLVDFVSGAIALVNSVLDGLRPDLIESSKTARRALRKTHAVLGNNWRITSTHDLRIKPIKSLMYAAVSAKAGEYFRDLLPLEDGINQLWPFINSTGLKVNILSAPIKTKSGISAGEGKYLWVQKYLAPQPFNFYIVPAVDKQKYAASNGPNILIDDKAATINQWNAAGGIGILHIPGNSQASIEQLKQILKRQ